MTLHTKCKAILVNIEKTKIHTLSLGNSPTNMQDMSTVAKTGNDLYYHFENKMKIPNSNTKK